uniref:Uncharacterized protein n=1 Tax=Rhizophora mucronata TaxID=61149 RepID=A0A2P2N2S7_RHIMU
MLQKTYYSLNPVTFIIFCELSISSNTNTLVLLLQASNDPF